MAWFAGSTWIFIDRDDVVAQAISLYFASTTSTWRKRLGHPFEAPDYEQIPYDFPQIKSLMDALVAEKSHWAEFFQHYGLDPIRITYEHAVEGFPDYLSEVFGALRLPMQPSRPRLLQKMGGAANQRLAERFREDLMRQ